MERWRCLLGQRIDRVQGQATAFQGVETDQRAFTLCLPWLGSELHRTGLDNRHKECNTLASPLPLQKMNRPLQSHASHGYI